MIVKKDANGKLGLSDTALQIKAFKKVYDYYCKEYDEDLALILFTFFFYMYDFTSHFYLDIEDEDQRKKEVAKFLDRGNEIKFSGTRVVKAALEVYKELYENVDSSAYKILHKNFHKLKDYAAKMTLLKGEVEGSEDLVYVDSKEFKEVNNLQQGLQNELQIYGKRDLGAYED